MSSLLTATLILVCVASSSGARILGIFPCPFFSHQVTFQAIMKALAARGHEVTVISTNPLTTSIENYTDVDLSFSYDYFRKFVDVSTFDDIDFVDYFHVINNAMRKILDIQMRSPQLQAFIRANDTKYDVVIRQNMFIQCYNGLIHHLGSPPVIGILSLGGFAFTYPSIGNPNNPSYCPDVVTPYSHHMTFWQRMYNTYVVLRTNYLWNFVSLPEQEALMRKHFGSSPPSVYESEYNDSLLLLNNHWSLNYPRPLLPNVVELTGLHLQNAPKPLPKNIQDFIEGAKHGVIYFSLGSNIRSEAIFKEKLKHILDAFSELPQRVIWKWEADFLPGKPKNVLVRKWLPQQAILAHPNVRAFITHGGLQSFQEAAYHGVPLIGMPFVVDQTVNVEKFVSAKIGVQLDFNELTKDTLLEALKEILTVSMYGDNMKVFSSIYREHAESSMDRAIWWIEYVIRHNGARHLRSAALDLTWYQYLLLDVATVIILCIAAFIFVIYVVLKKCTNIMLETFRVSKLKLA